MQVELVAPDAILFSGEADAVLCRTTEGEIAFLENHAPFLGELVAGDVVVRAQSGDQTVRITGGFAEVKNNKVTILSDSAELVS